MQTKVSRHAWKARSTRRCCRRNWVGDCWRTPDFRYDGGVIKDGFDDQLDKYRDATNNGQKWLAELEAKERKITGINNLKVGFNHVFGYYIEVTKVNLSKIPADRYQRKQTLANAERFSTPELKEKEALILEAEEQSKTLEYKLFVKIREDIKKID